MIEQLLRDYSVPYVTEGHKHSSAGWVNVHCPFCAGSQNYHLGIHEDASASHCWRCGPHPVVDALSKLLGIPPSEVKRILRKNRIGIIRSTPTSEPKVSIHPLKFPQPSFALNSQGHQYLSRRGFNAEYVEQEWGLLQTGPVSFLDGISYNHRILIPIYWNSRVVSFSSRDITGKSDKKYLACPSKRESIHHKSILYGKQEGWQKRDIIVVEGPVDVWRFGPIAAATFGTAFKMEQVLQLARHGDRFFIVFDNEPQAQDQARALAVKLRTLGKEVHIETVEGDPGDMKQEDADHFVKGLVGK